MTVSSALEEPLLVLYDFCSTKLPTIYSQWTESQSMKVYLQQHFLSGCQDNVSIHHHMAEGDTMGMKYLLENMTQAKAWTQNAWLGICKTRWVATINSQFVLNKDI